MKPEVYKMWNNTLNSVLNEQFLKKRVYGHIMGLVAGTKYVCICVCVCVCVYTYIYEIYMIHTHVQGKIMIWEEKQDTCLPNVCN